MSIAWDAQAAVHRLNAFLSTHLMAKVTTLKAKKLPLVLVHPDFKTMPLIWDTGTSQGLTPFLKDFIHYQPAHIPVKDVSKVN